MDRTIVFDAALFQTTDVLNTSKFAMVGQAWQNQALLGGNTSVAGFACTPTSPTATLNVVIGPGSIYQQDPTDSTAYGDLGTDSTVIVKQGLYPVATTYPITPPTTTGFSVVYLVEVALQDVDGGTSVLSYYNSANTNQPFSGPSNSGSSNNTTRTCKAAVVLKVGVPAATGSQVTPAADPGYVGLYAITVANGASQVLSNNIAQLSTAPFFPTLPQVPYQVQQGIYVYAGQDTGVANAYVITFAAGQPIPAAYTIGMKVSFTALHACSGASTVNVNGLGAVSIFRASGTALASGDINSGQIVELTYDGAHFQMANYLGSGTNTNTSTVVGVPYAADTGTQNQLIATFSPAITSGQQIAGLVITVKLANTITGACTINVNGLGVKNVTLGDLTNPPYNVFVAGMDIMLEYDGTEYQIVNTSAGMFYRRPTANYNIYVNASSGSDTLYDGTSATVTGVGTAGPFKTISKAILTAWSYAPSQFTITIQVAPGTYNESVQTPTYAGPNVVIDCGSPASVTVSSPNNYCFLVSGPNTLTVKNVTATNTSSSGLPLGCFGAINGATMVTANTVTLSCVFAFVSGEGATISPGNHTFSGSCTGFYFAATGGSLILGSSVHTISTSIAVSNATAVCIAGNILASALSQTTFANSSFVSGSKYNLTLNGTFDSNGLGVNYLPGSSAGTTGSGGQYV